MRKHLQFVWLVVLSVTIFSCNNHSNNSGQKTKGSNANSKFSAIAKQLMQSEIENPFSVSLSPLKTDFHLPAVHSFADAFYNGMLIIIGGEVAGFHGTSNNPPPFMTSVANDSMWVINIASGKSYGVPVPEQYRNSLAVTNPQSYQVGSSLYLCGGYTVSDTSQTRFNATSDFFFRIDLPSFIQYVQSGGTTPALDMVFPVAIENDFVRVTGGELFVENDHFYLIGGQNFNGVYSIGSTGNYTNAIRGFTLQQSGQTWSLEDLDSLVDSENLHRRDFNLVPFVESNGSLSAIILGGVFTPEDLSYNNPIYIRGLSNGNPSITVGTAQQSCNQYNCAIASMVVAPGVGMFYGLLGGISYMKYSSGSGGLVIGDDGIPMPFSNLVDFIITDGDSLAEFVQLPPQSLLPGYLGSNAIFMPFPQFVADGYQDILDPVKIFSDTAKVVNVGYMYGGILSNGPTAGTTAKGHINTYANPVLYSVDLSFEFSKTKAIQPK